MQQCLKPMKASWGSSRDRVVKHLRAIHKTSAGRPKAHSDTLKGMWLDA